MTAVLFVRLSAMGDVVQGLGAVESLHRERPEWRLGFVTQSTFAPLLQGVPGLARVVEFDRRGGLPALAAVRRELRSERWDVALDLQGNWKSALVARLSGARQRLGMDAPWRQEPASRILLQRTRSCAAMPHPARAAWELVRELAPEAAFRRPRLQATDDERAAERRALAAVGIAADRPFLVVVVTDPADARALPRDVARAAAAAAGMPCVQVLGPAEQHLEPLAGIPWLRHGRGEIRRLVALGSLAAAAGGGVLGPDQGATHVLAAAGAPSRVMFGAQDPRRTAPAAALAVALVHPDPPACMPCRRLRCGHPQGTVCMQFDPASGRRVDLGLPG